MGRSARAVGVVVALAVVAAMGAGCREQQLEERNVALTRQLEEVLAQNGDLQAELDRMRASPPAPAESTAAELPPEAAAPKPDFGPGVEVRTTATTMTVMLPDAILFASGSADLKSASKAVLDKVAGVLNKDYPNHMIRVEGHTDNQPIVRTKKLWSDNWDLACNRSMAVVRYLVTKGVDPKRIYASGFSYNQPVAANATAEGRAKNRRVEIVVAPR
jgi:chemotaxis protein MotB